MKHFKKLLFQNKLPEFESKLVMLYYKRSQKYFSLNYPYTEWILDFQRRLNTLNNANANYFIMNYICKFDIPYEEEKRFFHLFQFLSFLRSFKFPHNNSYPEVTIKNKKYYFIKFSLTDFIRFTNTSITADYQRKTLLAYFKKLQTLDPIIDLLKNDQFQSYVCFPFVGCECKTNNSWQIEILIHEELVDFNYPYMLPDLFLKPGSKNDSRMKFQFIQALATNEKVKIFNLESLFKKVSRNSKSTIQMKKSIIQLLNKLVEQNSIEPELKTISKTNRIKTLDIQELDISKINRTIHFIEFIEKL